MCDLSESASAFSAMMSALIGSVVNGFVSGYLVAFMTGWISWFAFLRVLIGGLYMGYRGVISSWEPEDDGDDDEEVKPLSGNHASDAHLEMTPSRTDVSISAAHESSSSGVESNTNPATLDSQQRLNDVSSAHSTVTPPHTQSREDVYNTLAPGGHGLSTPFTSKQFFLHVLWPTRADIRKKKQDARLNRQKRQHMRELGYSDRQLNIAMRGRVGRRPLVGTDPWPPLNREVTVFGWLGWVYGALYAPASQLIWVAANASNNNGLAKVVKGLSVAVTALPLCIDSRVRYADALRRHRWGSLWAYGFNITNAASCLLQAAICGTLLVFGVVQAHAQSEFGFPWPIVAIYPVFSLVWAWGSFQILPVRDGGRRRAAQAHWMGYFVDIGVGAFAGLFLAAPAFALYTSSKPLGQSGDDASNLTTYLSCESAWWKKFAAIFP